MPDLRNPSDAHGRVGTKTGCKSAGFGFKHHSSAYCLWDVSLNDISFHFPLTCTAGVTSAQVKPINHI